MRSILTMFGIIIGIGSVIMIVSVGNGVKNSISNQLNGAFGGQTYIMAGQLTGEIFTEAMFTLEDIASAWDKIDHMKSLSMEESGYAVASSKKGEKTAYYYAVTPDYFVSGTATIQKGRYFTQEEYDAAAPVCVLTENGAKNLFGHTDVIGQTFSFECYGKTKDLTVVGVKGKSGSQLAEMLYYEDEVEFDMPYTAYLDMTGRDDPRFTQLLFATDSMTNAEGSIKKLITLMEARKNIRGQHKISYISFTSYMDKIMQILNYITIFISFVAAISLVVGGVGVMNIMLVSVTERTREIGIRKALGARTSSIMIQFLSESAMLTLVGGVLGMLFGYLGGELICLIMSNLLKIRVVASINVWIVLGIVVFSAGIGMFFGIYPARKAAQLNPIDALRQE